MSSTAAAECVAQGVSPNSVASSGRPSTSGQRHNKCALMGVSRLLCLLLLLLLNNCSVVSAFLSDPSATDRNRSSLLNQQSKGTLSSRTACYSSVAALQPENQWKRPPRSKKESPSAKSLPTRVDQGSRVRQLAGPLEFLDVTLTEQQQEDEQLLVVSFYASYCKVCQRAGLALDKLAGDYNHSDGDDHQPPVVQFAKLECSQCEPRLRAAALRQLGVTKFPFVQIYRGGQCVASFRPQAGGSSFAKRVRHTVALCLARSDTEWKYFYQQHAEDMDQNYQARQSLQSALTTLQP